MPNSGAKSLNDKRNFLRCDQFLLRNFSVHNARSINNFVKRHRTTFCADGVA